MIIEDLIKLAPILVNITVSLVSILATHEISKYTINTNRKLNEENAKIYSDMLLWIINNFPKTNIFIEAQEPVNVFKIFGQYITEDGTPTYYNMLDKLGFKIYPENNTMFYMKR